MILPRSARAALLVFILLFRWDAVAATTHSFRGRVIGIQDGDTITVLDAARRQHRIRLAGIDAPERNQGFGSVSRRNLSNLVYGREVEVRVTKTDRYDRLVAKVVHTGRDICLAQLRAGLAWFYDEYQMELAPVDRLAYANAAADARKTRRGLWSDARAIPPWQFRREQRSSSPTPRETPKQGSIIGNRRSGIYHLPQCPDWAKVAPDHRRIFESEEAASAAGFRKARNCE